MSKKGSSSTQYDPQIGQAAAATSAASAKAEQFAEDFQTNEITPLLHQMVAASQKSQDREDQLFGLNLKQAQDASDNYDKYGKPAQDAYYKMVAQYSAPEEQEREAQAALGDQRMAEKGQEGDFMRNIGARGLNPASADVTAIKGDMAVQNAAAEASSMNRARTVARNLGLQLTSDAANFSNGGASSTLAFGNAASGNAQAGFGAAAGALGGANASSGTALAGYNTAIRGYGQNLDAYSRLGVADMQAQAQADAGFGQAIGGALGLATSFIPHSDRRLKKNIVRVGSIHPSIHIYDFDYRWGGPRMRGYMADEVEPIFPQAVVTDPSGFKRVNYTMVEQLCA